MPKQKVEDINKNTKKTPKLIKNSKNKISKKIPLEKPNNKLQDKEPKISTKKSGKFIEPDILKDKKSTSFNSNSKKSKNLKLIKISLKITSPNKNLSNIPKILSEVLSIVKPSESEIEDEVNFAENLVEHISENSPTDCEVVLTGSVAKLTFLKDKKDIDIFVLYNKDVKEEDLEGLIKKVMENAFPGLSYQLSYAEHPYIRFTFEGHKIDLVPAYKISDASERISAVDRSVLHTAFINHHLKPERIDDVLLLKAFLKSNSLYGAEIKIQGFSGYLCELMIVAYGTFKKLMTDISESTEEQIFVDLMKYYKKNEIDEAKSRFGTSLVVIDPTDKDRNVSAALSKINFDRFKTVCSEFLKNPSKEIFFRKPLSFEDKVSNLKSKYKFVVTLPRPNIVDDVLWGQIHKLTGQLKAALKEYSVREILADDSEHLIRFSLAVDKTELPAKKTVQGPPLEMKKNVEDFKKTHQGSKFSQKNGKITAQISQEQKKLEDAVLDFFRNYSKTTKSHLAYSEEFIIVTQFVDDAKII